MTIRWLLLVVALSACAKKQEPSGGSGSDDRAPAMSPAEIQRSQDACKGYVERACACAETVAALKQPCALAKALPEAVQIGLEVAANPESTRADALSAQGSVRKAVKECVEQTARLPSMGCPP